jgi:hypothetical protein
MNKFIALIFMFVFPLAAGAAEAGDWFFDPHASVGFNTVQGTNFRLGADLGMYVTENIRGGVGGYYAFGEKPQYDREIGAGPFADYVLPLTSFLVLSAREEIDYVDARVPVTVTTVNGPEDSYEKLTGVNSATSVGVHVFFTPNFVVSGGYRAVLALTNSRLDDGRSGTFFGFAFGI